MKDFVLGVENIADWTETMIILVALLIGLHHEDVVIANVESYVGIVIGLLAY